MNNDPSIPIELRSGKKKTRPSCGRFGDLWQILTDDSNQNNKSRKTTTCHVKTSSQKCGKKMKKDGEQDGANSLMI